MFGGNSRYLSVTLSSALIMRTLIVNTKLGFHFGAATGPTQATLAGRQNYGEQRIIHSQSFFGQFLLQVFGGTSGLEISDFNWNLFSQNMEAGKPWEMHFMLSICQKVVVVVVVLGLQAEVHILYLWWWFVLWILGIRDNSNNTLANYTSDSAHCLFGPVPAPPKYLNGPEGLTNINKRIVFLIFSSHSGSHDYSLLKY